MKRFAAMPLSMPSMRMRMCFVMRPRQSFPMDSPNAPQP